MATQMVEPLDLIQIEDSETLEEADAARILANCVCALPLRVRDGAISNLMDVREIRRATGLTQASFAAAYRLPLRTLQEWAQGRMRPDGGTLVYLALIAANPLEIAAMVAQLPK